MKKYDLKSLVIGFLACSLSIILMGQTFTIGTVEETQPDARIPTGNYQIECWPGAVKTHARCVVFDTLNAQVIGRFNSHNVEPMSKKLIAKKAYCPTGSSCN